ncbi:MAG: acylneuraminate cytidylyltransferase family protein [Bacilli bacterium]
MNSTRNIAIIPARCGSKGLVDKNIRPLNKIPLIAYTIKCALNSNLFDEVMVSTDSQKYADISLSLGASVPVLRSNINSSDVSDSWDTVKEVLSYYNNLNIKFDTICLLQPTSPLRKVSDIIRSYEDLVNTEGNYIVSMCECDHSPLWTTILPHDRSMKSYFENNLISNNRQGLEKFYRINGAIYIKKIKYSNEIELLDDMPYATIMDQYNSIDIDTQMDFELAEFLMHKMENIIK